MQLIIGALLFTVMQSALGPARTPANRPLNITEPVSPSAERPSPPLQRADPDPQHLHGPAILATDGSGCVRRSAHRGSVQQGS